MLSITESWYKNIDEPYLNVSIFLNFFFDIFEKTFDTFNRDVLLSKLSALGVTGKMHCWFTLPKIREQVCCIGGQKSSTSSILWFSPGIVLGALAIHHIC